VPDLVIDASIALAWFLPDESSAYALTALAAVEQSTIHVPDLWAYEVANGLVIASRRKRIKPADVPVLQPRSPGCACMSRAATLRTSWETPQYPLSTLA
jgi:hypothetical protein